MRRWDDGGLLQRTPLGSLCRRRFGAPYYAVHRADLHGGLLSLVPPDRVHLGARLRRRDTGAPTRRGCTCPTVRRSRRTWSSAPTASTRSAREQIVADEPRYSGQTIYRGLVPAERVPFLLTEPRVQLWLGPDQHCRVLPGVGRAAGELRRDRLRLGLAGGVVVGAG